MQTDSHLRGLVARYNRPGPRYTSYPPAVHFRTDVNCEALQAQIGARGGALSLYVHLPFCESHCWFCGCNTITTRSRNMADGYLDLLEREIELTAALRGGEALCGREVVQLHFGGGTPNFLTVAQILRLGEMLKRYFHFAADAECSVELDPRRLSEAQVAAFAQIGMNRASFGVQDCDPRVQQAINRVQSMEANRNAMQWLRKHGFRSVNLDLIYGLPHQTPESFAATLDEVLTLDPDRFAVFSYAHVPWLRPAQKLLERGSALPDAQRKVELLSLVLKKLESAGYRSIGMDHFARPQDELCLAQEQGTLQRNFQGYSTRADCEIIGLGLSSISQTEGSYRQNHKTMADYRAALEAGRLPVERGCLLTAEDRLRRTVIQRLMCDLKLDYSAMGNTFAIDFRRYFSASLAALEPLAADGLVVLAASGLRVTPRGRWFIRNIAMCFDAYLTAPPVSEKRPPVPARGDFQGAAGIAASGAASPATAGVEDSEKGAVAAAAYAVSDENDANTREAACPTVQQGANEGAPQRQRDGGAAAGENGVPQRRYSQTV